MPQIYWNGRSLSKKARTHPYFCCSVQLCMAIVCIFSGGKEVLLQQKVLLNCISVLRCQSLTCSSSGRNLENCFCHYYYQKETVFFSLATAVSGYPAMIFFLWRWKGGLKFLWVSVDSSSVILYPASEPTDSHCCLQLLQLLSTEAFSSCYAHIPDTYPPLFISCHELEWTIFGISPALYESFYKRITLPLGDHVRWFPLSGALSSPV